jgi:hypothetical protein
VLAFGLGVTVFSDLPSLRLFGFICGTTLLASLLADLVFLPAIIMLIRKVWPHRWWDRCQTRGSDTLDPTLRHGVRPGGSDTYATRLRRIALE